MKVTININMIFHENNPSVYHEEPAEKILWYLRCTYYVEQVTWEVFMRCGIEITQLQIGMYCRPYLIMAQDNF